MNRPSGRIVEDNQRQNEHQPDKARERHASFHTKQNQLRQGGEEQEIERHVGEGDGKAQQANDGRAVRLLCQITAQGEGRQAEQVEKRRAVLVKRIVASIKHQAGNDTGGAVVQKIAAGSGVAGG